MRTGLAEHTPVFQAHGGKASTPKAARIEREQPGFIAKAQGRPMATDNGVIGAGPPGNVEPGQASSRPVVGRPLRTLGTKLHRTGSRQVAHASHGVDHHPQPVPAGEIVAPCGRFRAPHVRQKFLIVRRLQGHRHLIRQSLRLRHRPFRQQAGMNHGPFTLDVEQWLRTKPCKQVVAVGRSKYRRQGVFLAGLAVTLGLHHQMQVVVPEYHASRRTEGFDEAQHIQRRRPAIHKVANKPQAVGGRIEADIVKQAPQRIETALQVANCIGSHGRRV